MEVKTIGVVGLGLLGRGIAACFVAHGFDVIGYDRDRMASEHASRYIGMALNELVSRGGYPVSLLDRAHQYSSAGTLDELRDCNFVIESVIEDLATKEKVFDELESIVGAETPIASNTSALPITLLQSKRRIPERFLGMHWAEPAYVTRFLELIRGDRTSDAAFDIAARLGRQAGKEVSIVNKDIPGFIANRLGYAVYREALNLVELGIGDVATVDASFRNSIGLWAMICGPFRWIDLTGGPALYGLAMRGVLPTLSSDTELPMKLRELMDSGAQGVTNGRGFFEYTPEEAAQWAARYHEHAYRVRQLMDDLFPLQ